MNIGIIPDEVSMVSVKSVFQCLEHTLAQQHEIVRRPLEYFYVPAGKQKEMCAEFLRKCDLTIGKIDEKILQAREQLERQPPLIGFLMGEMSRGAAEMLKWLPFLKSTDVLVGNCTADVEITKKFFTNAQIRKLPFAFDESTYFPLDEQQRTTIRAEMRFRPEDKILLYAGRITLEKNVHTLLRIFSVLQDLVPDLHLVVAGEPHSIPFQAMGVYPVSSTATLMKVMNELRIRKEQVHFIGSKNPAQLRELYAMADLLVNLTLHHDENFGLSQIEALACGTPVIGTSWGGLKDTIKHGETGYQISTVVTDSGVKINWWEAINRFVSVLEDDSELQRLRENCRPYAAELSSPARYAENLSVIVDGCRSRSDGPGEPLKLTDFAREFWLECQAGELSASLFQRGPKSFDMYKALIAPFTGTTENVIPNDEPLDSDQLVVLAVPVRMNQSALTLDDPIFPLEFIVPESNKETAAAILDVMRREPVVRFERLQQLIPAGARSCLQTTLKWMLEKGILLRTRLMAAGLDPEMIGEQLGQPVFAIQAVDFTTDVIVIRQAVPAQSYAAT